MIETVRVMQILDKKINLSELNKIAEAGFGEMIKGVVDVERDLLALDAQLHSDLEGLLLQHGSKQNNLWGINLYPQASQEDFIEYDSAINLRPSVGNRSRGVDNEATRKRIVQVVANWVQR